MTVPFRRPLAAVGLALAVAGATLVGAPPALAATPTQVALYVEYPNGSSKHWCVTYRSGMSGADVLAAAGPTYGTGPYAGFVLQIGGRGTVPPTKTDYWAYWVTQNGSLVYSGAGVTSTQPAAGTVEAWHWNASTTTEQPASVSYGELCPNGTAAPAPATPAPATPAPATAPAASAKPTSAATTSRTSTDPTTPAASTSAAPTTSGPAPTTSAARSTTPAAGSTTSVAASDVASTRDTSGGGTGPLLGLVVALLAVCGLGVAAVVARRRRAEGD